MYSFSDKVFKIGPVLKQLESCAHTRLVLFGAGGWGAELLDELVRLKTTIPILFADNDVSKIGMIFKGKPVISPQALDTSKDIIVITSISAGDQISIQLEGMGFERDINYFEVMHNLDFTYPFAVLEFYEQYVKSFEYKNILHVGPGGNLGVEILLLALGAKSVTSVEYNSFGLSYPDVTSAKDFYQGLAEEMENRWDISPFEKGGLLLRQNRMLIDSGKIRLVCPCSITALPFKDNSFDLVLHHAVFEHVANPLKGYEEIFRVLVPNGITVGLVDPQDHRTFSSSQEYYPLKFLEYTRDKWYTMSSRINFHNQITTPEHRKMIYDAGFDIKLWDGLMQMDISDELWQQFNPMFHEFNKEELGVLRFAFSASKITS